MNDLGPHLEILTRLIELAGVGVIVLTGLVATGLFLAKGFSSRAWRSAYAGYRANLGRGILLGLEFLVGADIIATVTAPLTLESVGLLGLVVLIRTFSVSRSKPRSRGAGPGVGPRRTEPDAAASDDGGLPDPFRLRRLCAQAAGGPRHPRPISILGVQVKVIPMFFDGWGGIFTAAAS